MTWRMVDLFTGLGGFSLAASHVWDDLEVVTMCEIDKRCRDFLHKTWPGVEVHDDIKTLTVDTIVSLCYGRLPQEKKEIIDMGILDKKYDEAVNLYEKGMSIGDVAAFYGITRQAMWLILKRRGCVFRSNLKFGSYNHFYRDGTTAPDRIHNLTEIAIEKGILVRQTHCSNCQSTTPPICSHHDDYNKPLEVRWLCTKCHFEWHTNNKAAPLTIDFPPMTRGEIGKIGGKACADKMTPLQRKERTYKALSVRYGKEVMPDELRRELEDATTIDILTGGVP